MPAYIDVEGPIRQWVRANVPSVNNRVIFGIGKGATFPLILQSLVDLSPLAGSNMVAAWMQFDVLAARLEEGGTKLDASTPAMELMNAAEALVPGTQIGDLLAYGASVGTYGWRPAAQSGQPRYRVDVTFHVAAL